MPPFFHCFGCGRELDALTFLREVTVWWSNLDAAGRTCTVCDYRDELRLSTGKMELGYIYAAGTAHFAGVEQHLLPGLRVTSDGHDLKMEYQQHIWSIPAAP